MAKTNRKNTTAIATETETGWIETFTDEYLWRPNERDLRYYVYAFFYDRHQF